VKEGKVCIDCDEVWSEGNICPKCGRENWMWLKTWLRPISGGRTPETMPVGAGTGR